MFTTNYSLNHKFMSMMIKIRSCLQRLILRNFCFKL